MPPQQQQQQRGDSGWLHEVLTWLQGEARVPGGLAAIPSLDTTRWLLLLLLTAVVVAALAVVVLAKGELHV